MTCLHRAIYPWPGESLPLADPPPAPPQSLAQRSRQPLRRHQTAVLPYQALGKLSSFIKCSLSERKYDAKICLQQSGMIGQASHAMRTHPMLTFGYLSAPGAYGTLPGG
jgi:hypothetical protein